MQFSNSLAILALAALFQAAFAAPCARDSGYGATSTLSAAKPARPAPMPFLRPGYTKLEADEERIYDFVNGDAEVDEPRYSQEVLRASAPPPLMRMFAERRTSRP